MATELRTEKKKPNRFSQQLMWIIGVLAVILIVYQVADEARKEKLLDKGTTAPSFSAERFTGGTLQSDELHGKVVMLDFWATWCPPCVEEMPSLVRLAQEYESKGLIFVAANRDEASTANAAVSRFVGQKVPGLGPSVVYANDEMSTNYRAMVLPTLYFIDRDGRILETATGYNSEASLRRRIERSLK